MKKVKKVKQYLDVSWRKVSDWLMIAGSINNLLDDIETLDLADWNVKYEQSLGKPGFKDENSFKGTIRRTYNYLKKYKSFKRSYAMGQVQTAVQYGQQIQDAYNNRYAIKVIKKVVANETRIYYILEVKYKPPVAVPGYYLGRTIPLPKRINNFRTVVLPSKHPDLVNYKNFYIHQFSTYTYEICSGKVVINDLSHSESMGLMPEYVYVRQYQSFNIKDLRKYIANDFSILHDKHEDWLVRYLGKNASIELFLKKQEFVFVIVGGA